MFHQSKSGAISLLRDVVILIVFIISIIAVIWASLILRHQETTVMLKTSKASFKELDNQLQSKAFLLDIVEKLKLNIYIQSDSSIQQLIKSVDLRQFINKVEVPQSLLNKRFYIKVINKNTYKLYIPNIKEFQGKFNILNDFHISKGKDLKINVASSLLSCGNEFVVEVASKSKTANMLKNKLSLTSFSQNTVFVNYKAPNNTLNYKIVATIAGDLYKY